MPCLWNLFLEFAIKICKLFRNSTRLRIIKRPFRKIESIRKRTRRSFRALKFCCLSISLRFFLFFKWAATWDFQQCGMCNQQRLRPACAYAQSDQSVCLSLAYSMSVKLLTEHHLVFLSLKGGCTGSSESTLVKMPHCLKSHVVAHIIIFGS